MPERKPSVVIGDILGCISRMQQYTSDLSFEAFAQNFMVAEACLYNIQIIGEAVVHLPDELKQKETPIPWKLMKGMRNRLIHEYFGTDLPLVWRVIKEDIPSFEATLKTIMASLQKDGR